MESMIARIEAEGGAFGPWLVGLLALGVAVVVALSAHQLAMVVLKRAVRRSSTPNDDIMLAATKQPLKWIMVGVAVSAAQAAVPLNAWGAELWRQAAGFIVPGLFGWLAIAMVHATLKIVQSRADIATADNLQARRVQTRAGILARIAIVAILFLTICVMLLSISAVRSVGVTLMASAGLVGLAAAAAAQPALKNLVAGVQLAFTEPIRIDDVVIVAGEWGRIETIRLTYVVVKVWDERRLVVPVSKFLEEPFENWTRESSQLLGSAFFYVDPTADVGRMRAKLEEIMKAATLWDGRFFNLQVTDIKPDAMEVRALMTASDASRAFDLRCDVREAMMAFLTAEMPEALPRHRLETARIQADFPERKLGDAG